MESNFIITEAFVPIRVLKLSLVSSVKVSRYFNVCFNKFGSSLSNGMQIGVSRHHKKEHFNDCILGICIYLKLAFFQAIKDLMLTGHSEEPLNCLAQLHLKKLQNCWILFKVHE